MEPAHLTGPHAQGLGRQALSVVMDGWTDGWMS